MPAPKVIITLTTVPKRLDNIPDGLILCIDSLTSQNYDNYEVHFNIPNNYKLTGEEYIIPEWLSKRDDIKIFRVDDFGPLTKVVPTFKRIEDPETIIIVVDDDLVYLPDMINEHVRFQSEKERVYGYDGIALRDGPHFEGDDVRNHYVVGVPVQLRTNIMQHYKSVSYKRKYIEEDFFTDFVGKSQSDDVTLSAYCNSKDLPLIVCPSKGEPVYKDVEEWREKAGVLTFPVKRHTAIEMRTGCNDPLAEQRFFMPKEWIDKGWL